MKHAIQIDENDSSRTFKLSIEKQKRSIPSMRKFLDENKDSFPFVRALLEKKLKQEDEE